MFTTNTALKIFGKLSFFFVDFALVELQQAEFFTTVELLACKRDWSRSTISKCYKKQCFIRSYINKHEPTFSRFLSIASGLHSLGSCSFLCVELNALLGDGKACFTSELPKSKDRVLVAVVEAAAKNTFDFSNSNSLTVFSTGYNPQYWKPRQIMPRSFIWAHRSPKSLTNSNRLIFAQILFSGPLKWVFKGCKRCDECGGIHNSSLSLFAQKLSASRELWLEGPSKNM